MISMRELLTEVVKREASDLHITPGAPPMFRIDGKLVKSRYEVVTPETSKRLAYSIMTEKQKQKFEENWEADLSFGIEGLSRFRTNIFLQQGLVAMALRRVPTVIKGIEELRLPKIIGTFTDYPKGLILVTGPTGTGKSTTLAALIDKINTEKHLHILTVEDPIEFVHKHKSSIVNQREVYSDTKTFATALKYAMREDPDVVMIGEMRDLETIGAALTIAETGHLTFATLHTNSCAETINRIIDVFPPAQQTQVRVQLSFVLRAIVTQQLIPMIGGGRIVATEILITIPAIRAQIREDKIHQIYSTMQAGQKYGMQTMNMSIAELYLRGIISLEEAYAHSFDPTELNDLIIRKKERVSRGA
ncbi:MAG: type IV pili twitching motility protein PilT [candidate division Zixibacteria bacterium 4484_93]|nr:MAG: type IV pili twitching motility protein PilT [candidate division Zixibacteria bacterium 4484_93]